MHEIVLSVKNLVKKFGKHKAVAGISFEVTKNSIFGILGPNGSGKTTTLRILTTILPPTSGRIKVLGLEHRNDLTIVRENIGYVPQADALYKNLSVKDNVDLFFSAYSWSGERRARIEGILKRVNLFECRKELAKNLSGGMLKRLSIACAIVHEPKVLLFDEVTMGLDPAARQSIWDLVKELKEHATIIMTTHYMDEAEELCDELIIMREGKIIASGEPKQIIRKYQATSLQEVFKSL